MTTENLYAVILGDKSKVKGGSGKVINSKPEDRIFIYYADHGGPGVLGELSMSSRFCFIQMGFIIIYRGQNCKLLQFVYSV